MKYHKSFSTHLEPRILSTSIWHNGEMIYNSYHRQGDNNKYVNSSKKNQEEKEIPNSLTRK